MDEHMLVKNGRVIKLKGNLIDANLNGLTWWVGKHNSYATREAIDIVSAKYGDDLEFNVSLLKSASRKRRLKNNVYLRLPIGYRVFALFFYKMIFNLGVLDGVGIKFHLLQCLWYRFLVDLKVIEIEKRMDTDGVTYIEAIRIEHGINVSS